eukprot:scaffold59640_cov50-Attheya_sp.AAC.3
MEPPHSLVSYSRRCMEHDKMDQYARYFLQQLTRYHGDDVLPLFVIPCTLLKWECGNNVRPACIRSLCGKWNL